MRATKNYFSSIQGKELGNQPLLKIFKTWSKEGMEDLLN